MTRRQQAMIGIGLALAVAIVQPAHAEMVTVRTAAGIKITVAPDFAGRMQAFIADLVARGIKPRRIHCYSLARSHVRRSLHKTGRACDFNGSANRFSAMNRHRVSAIAHAHGLRDGCDFHDCGHIDAGRKVARRHNHVRMSSN